jgi:hypothetical protein
MVGTRRQKENRRKKESRRRKKEAALNEGSMQRWCNTQERAARKMERQRQCAGEL